MPKSSGELCSTRRNKEGAIIMYCAKCGALNDDSNAFCHSCGKELVVARDAVAMRDDSTSSDDTAVPQDENIDSGPAEVRESIEPDKQMPQGLRVVIALIVCAGIYLAYVVIGVLLGWEHGGGFIPIMIMLTLMGCVWRAMVGFCRK